MSFMGLYTEKEVKEIRELERKVGYEDGARYTKTECKKEENKIVNQYEQIISIQTRDNINLRNDIKELNLKLIETEEEIKNKSDEIKTLRFFLSCECDKEIDRLEKIAKRTNKYRIKKKCESRILDYKMRKLAFE